MTDTQDCRLIDIFDHLNDIVIILDDKQWILELNCHALKYFNCAKTDLLRRLYLSICQSQGLEPIENLANGTATTKTLTGQNISWKIIDRKILIGKILDVSDDYLSSILTADYEGLNIYWCDKENRVLLCNNTQARLFGFQTRDEILGKTVEELCAGYVEPNADFRADIRHNNLEIMTSRTPRIFEEGNSSLGWFLSYKAPFVDTNGEIRGIMGISTNISERKALETELTNTKHATDTYLENILLSSRSNIYWMDAEGRIIGCNDQQAKCFGLTSRMDLIGKNIFDVGVLLGWDPEIPKRIRELDLKVMQESQESIHEETVILDAREHIYLTSKSPMYDQQGEVVGIMGIATDITPLKQAQKELESAMQNANEASRYKSEFIANISHDIRTPLVGISGVGSWLLENVPVEFRPDIIGIVNASNELLALLNNVINLTKLESDEHHQKVIETFDLHELILRMTQLFAPLVTYKNLTLNLIYPELIPRRFRSMPSLIQRILLNLISNALKFTSQGEVTIRITRDNDILTANPEDFPLLLIVEDTGIGIPESKYDFVFEEFHRLNPAYQGQYRGSGLGLSIVKKFVENLGGKVWVTSQPGKGSRFFVRLPLTRSKEAGAVLTTDSEIENDLKICLNQYINP